MRVTDGYHPEMTVVEPCRVGTLRVPGGLLAVSGPDADDGDGPRITVPVPPGEYVLDEARVRFSYPCESWDAESRTGGRELSHEEARARDAPGLPYAVIHRAPGREVPLGVRMVAWRAGVLAGPPRPSCGCGTTRGGFWPTLL
ncbi:hypothetical protein ADK59_18020 [Streptomyces sp. XY332]|nr:hypothetical protein ADK59_18020 [Streptomyces sp. XY332]